MESSFLFLNFYSIFSVEKVICLYSLLEIIVYELYSTIKCDDFLRKKRELAMSPKTNISPDRQKLLVYLILTVVTFAVYWQVNAYDFINFDDNLYISENNYIQSGVTPDGFQWALTTKISGLWNPLVWLSFMFDYQLFGLNAGGYHLTNLFLHILSSLLLFWLFHRMTGALWRSAFVAGLFALHPLHVESVAWISERKDVLSAFFWMLTLCFYVYYTEKPAMKRYLPVLFSFILALMSKPMVVTLPVVMILLDYWPLKRFESHQGKTNVMLWQVKEKLPLFLLSAMLVIFTLYAPDNYHMPDKPDLTYLPLIPRLANAPVAFVTYLLKTFWPCHLAIFYPFTEHIPWWQILGSIFFIIAITAFVMVVAKRLPWLLVGWLWFAITIALVIGIIQISAFTPYAMADRYHYLPSIGLAVMMAWGIPPLLKSDAQKKILFLLATVFMILMAGLTWKQCGYWKNNFTLYNHTLKITDDNNIIHNNLGAAFLDAGKFHESIYHFNKAIQITPTYIDALLNRGNAYNKLAQYALALQDFTEVIRMKPYHVDYRYSRGIVYGKLGSYQRAFEDFNEVIRLKPDHADAFSNRGICYDVLGHPDPALADFNKALRLKPNDADALKNRAVFYFKRGNKKLGCNDAQKACTLKQCNVFELARSKGYCR